MIRLLFVSSVHDYYINIHQLHPMFHLFPVCQPFHAHHFHDRWDTSIAWIEKPARQVSLGYGRDVGGDTWQCGGLAVCLATSSCLGSDWELRKQPSFRSLLVCVIKKENMFVSLIIIRVELSPMTNIFGGARSQPVEVIIATCWWKFYTWMDICFSKWTRPGPR